MKAKTDRHGVVVKPKTASGRSMYAEIREMIASSRERVAVAVNAELTMLYWRVGDRIRRDLLENKRASYGQRIVEDLAARLGVEFGSGWNVKTLRHCLRAAETFTEERGTALEKRER